MYDEQLRKSFKRELDNWRKEEWRKAVQNGKIANLKVVCGFISLFEDDSLAKCSECGIEVSIRGWLKTEVDKHSVPILCINCVDIDENSEVI